MLVTKKRQSGRYSQRMADAQSAAANLDQCFGCGYNITGLAASACCPECATPVARSFADAHLIRPRSRFRVQLLWGSGIIAVGVGAELLGPTINKLITREWTDDARDSLRITMMVVAQLVWYAGGTLFSSRDQSSFEPTREKVLRRIVQFAFLAAAICTILRGIYWARILATPLVPLSQFSNSIDRFELFGTLLRIGTVASLISIALFATTMFYTRQLAQRLPSTRIEKLAGFLGIAGPALLTAQLFRGIPEYIHMASFAAHVAYLILFCWIFCLLLLIRGARPKTAAPSPDVPTSPTTN